MGVIMHSFKFMRTSA